MRKPGKTAWEQLSSSWKRVAAVIGAVATVSTLVCSIFPWEAGKVTAIGALAGVLILFVGWAIDKQQEYMDGVMEDHIEAAEGKMAIFQDSVRELKDIAEDTRRDTLRIQLNQYLQYNPDNIDTILKLAETYFCEMGGNWVMRAEFMKWAESHNVQVPLKITKAVEEVSLKK